MNLKELTGEETYVFKTSDISLKILNSIDRDNGSDMMSKQCCFFDAKENRFRGMSTYTLSVYHPLLRQQIPLATMDCVGETYVNAVTFFQNLNTALIEKFGVATQFNPCRFILDGRGCNWRTINAVYGPGFLKRCFSCEFHYKQSVNRRKNTVIFTADASGEQFELLAISMLEAQTEAHFVKCVENMERFLSQKTQRNSL